MDEINEIFDNIFILTVKGSIREPLLERRFKGLNYNVMYGVNGLHLDTVECEKSGINTKMDSNDVGLSVGQIAPSMSHVKIYQKMVDEDIDKCLIIEDDCVFLDDIKYFKEYYEQLPNDWGLVYVGWKNQGKGRPEPNFNKNIWKVTKEMGTHIVQTHCYMVTKDFAKKLIDTNTPIKYTCDGVLDVIINEKNEECYCFLPFMAIQDASLSGVNATTTKIDDIVYKRKEHTGI